MFDGLTAVDVSPREITMDSLDEDVWKTGRPARGEVTESVGHAERDPESENHSSVLFKRSQHKPSV